MSKPKPSNNNSSSKQLMNVSITSPKGSLIAEINNLRKQLKDYKQLKKQSSSSSGFIINNQRPTKDHNCHHNLFSNDMKSPKQQHQKYLLVQNIKSPTHQIMSKSHKQKFFKSSTNNNINTKGSDHLINSQTTEKITNNQNPSKKLFVQTQKQKDSSNQKLQIQLQSINVKQKDRKLKLDIQLNKLRKIITKLGPQQISQQVNNIIKIINLILKQYVTKIQRLQLSQQYDNVTDQQLLIRRRQQQLQQLTERIQQLQQQKKHLTKQLQSINQQNQSTNNDKKRQQSKQLTQYINKLQSLQQSVNQFQSKAIQLQQQNRILSIKLLKKQQQLLLIDEDINYLRMQIQNYKQQKNEFSQLYQSLMGEYREYKLNKTMQIQQLQIQKQKWQKQCRLKRAENESIKQLEEQKLLVMKELQQMRMVVNLKSVQLEEKKGLFYQNQKRVIGLESQVYKLKGELVTIKNEKEYQQYENQRLRQQMESMKKYGVSRRNSYNNNNSINDIRRDNNGVRRLSVEKNNSNSNSISRSKSKQKLIPSLSSQQQQQQLLINTVNFNNNNNISSNNNSMMNKLYQQQQHQQQQHQRQHQYQQQQQQHPQLSHFNKKLKDKQQKLKALDDIHSLIKKHRNNITQM